METNNNLRGALSKILVIAEYLQTRCGVPKFVANEISEIEQAAKAALAEPIKNCEVGTVAEQAERWNNENPYPYEWDDRQYLDTKEVLKWAQMPYDEGGREVRLCEFATSSSEGSCGKELFAWARYKRGDVPTQGEFAYIDGRVKAKFPSAELVSMERRFVPVANSAEPTEVWWEFKWIVFNRREGGAE